MDRIADTYMAYQFIKRLNTPFEHWDAFKNGVIDETGKVLIRRGRLTDEQRKSWGRFDVLVANLKRLLAKLPGGSTKLATLAATVMLLKEETLDENNVDLLAEQLEHNIALLKDEMDLPTDNLIEGFRILNKTEEPPEGFGVPHHVEHWYQGRQNGWCVQVKDKHDNQVGEAEYHYHKADAKKAHQDLVKQHNLSEDVAVSNVGGGQIAGVGIGPQGEPGKTQPKKKRKPGELPTTNIFTRKSHG